MRVRRVAVGIATASLLIGAAVPAAAQTTTTVSAAEAGSSGLTLTVAGEPVLGVAETAVAAIPGEAAALGEPLALGGEAIGGLAVDSDGPAVADDGCVTPEVPSPLDALVAGGLACAEVSADGDARSASATAGVAEAGVLALDGADLGPLSELLATLPLEDVLDALEDALLAELSAGDGVFGDVRSQCADALDVLGVGGLLDDLLGPLADAGPEEIGALLDAIDDLLGTLSLSLPLVCDVLGDLADVLTADGLLAGLNEGDLLDALAGVDGVLSVTLLETTSAVDRDGDTVTAAAGPAEGGAIAITLDVPLLEDVLAGLLADAVAPALEAVQGALAPLGDAVADVPVVGDLVGPLLSEGDLAAVLEGPLLTIGVLPGSSTATGDLASGVTDGTSAPAVVELGGTLFELPILAGLDDALDGVAGALDDALLSELRDSPLADLLEVALLPGEVTDGSVQGLPGTRASSGTASVALLGALGDPLVDLQVAPAVAAVGIDEVTDVAPEPEPTPVTTAGPDPEPLPVTGASAALLGLLALGAAGSLRRRR